MRDNKGWPMEGDDMPTEGPTPKGVIDHRLNTHREQLYKLRELTGVLIDAVAPVLGPERSENDSGSSEADGPSSLLARELDDLTDIVLGIQRSVEGTLSRIEL